MEEYNLVCIQGMSFIAAILLLNMEEADAFIVFANLVNRPLLAAFYRVFKGIVHKKFFCKISNFGI